MAPNSGSQVHDQPSRPLRWYQGVPRYAWMVLAVCALGWMFDTMDQHLFNLVRSISVAEILHAKSTDKAVKEMGPILQAVFMLGWATGGFVFGMLGDRLGRTRTMVITILMYAVFTGVNALVRTPFEYGVCRFLTAMGVGGEFAAGAALVAEVWPDRSRPMALGLLQALSAVGNMSAAAITYMLAAQSWRVVYVVGAVPALLVLWIRAAVREPEKWQKVHDTASPGDSAGSVPPAVGSLRALLSEPATSRNAWAGVLMATAGVGGLWGVALFLPDLIGTVFKQVAPSQAQMQQLRSTVFVAQNLGAFVGMFGYAALSERIGRRPALGLVFALAFMAIQATFWGMRTTLGAHLLAFQMGIFCLAPFAAYAVYFPELFPTRLRATGVGFCYNCARVLAAITPYTLGKLSGVFESPLDPSYGLKVAATIVSGVYLVGFVGLRLAPETKGRPLPE